MPRLGGNNRPPLLAVQTAGKKISSATPRWNKSPLLDPLTIGHENWLVLPVGTRHSATLELSELLHATWHIRCLTKARTLTFDYFTVVAVIATVCGLPGALSTMLRTALDVPGSSASNTTRRVQLFPGPRRPEQFRSSSKSSLSVCAP